MFPQDVPIEHRGPFPGARVNGKFATRVDAEDAGLKDWYVKPRMAPPWGLHPGMSIEDAKAFDQTACEVQHFDPEKWKIMQRRVGVGDNWDLDKVRAFDEMGKGMYLKITARVCAVRNFTTIDQCDVALKFCQDQMDNPELEMADRLLAVRMFAEVVKARTVLIQQTVDLAKEGQERQESTKPRNLPPMLGVSVNVNSGQGGKPVVQIEQRQTANDGDGVIEVEPSV